jgi:hypothetical protein
MAAEFKMAAKLVSVNHFTGDFYLTYLLIYLLTVDEHLSMSACLEHSASNL